MVGGQKGYQLEEKESMVKGMGEGRKQNMTHVYEDAMMKPVTLHVNRKINNKETLFSLLGHSFKVHSRSSVKDGRP